MNNVEELLKPRYKVIANYPGMKGEGLEVGKVITCKNYFNDFSEKLWCEMNDEYPHLFKKLEWWEDRKQEELPEYVKNGINGKVKKVKRYHFFSSIVEFEGGRERRLNSKMIPATKEEYEAQNLITQ